jgi:hypothetical protein
MASWALGYVSGKNVGVGLNDNPHDFLQDTDADGVWSWLDNYCRANPLDNLGMASEKLVRELIRRKVKPMPDAGSRRPALQPIDPREPLRLHER